jgi:hypothetical protein
VDRQAKADVRGIEQPIALQILKTPARYAQTGEGNTKQLREIEPPLIRLRTQDHRPRPPPRTTPPRTTAQDHRPGPPPRTTAHDHRVFFRDKGDCLEISRVLDRKEAYR